MDEEIPFDSLLQSIWLPVSKPGATSRLLVAESPSPFVAPTLQVPQDDLADPFAAELILVEAPAAVGKTTMARALSASRRAPLLNLAQVPVATGSLKALISDVPMPDPVRAFHSAELPLIVDALDEGRMLSGDRGFEAFLETTGEFLLSDRRQVRRPKLVILGRHDSIDLARTGLEILGGDLTVASITVGFFDKAAALEMITAYADSVAEPNAAYRKSPQPVHALVQAYFDAIEAALGLHDEALWTDPTGRAFAGYAPVLSALGLLLAEVENFQVIENRLRKEGTREAWGVIEEVLDTILSRERNKLCDQLKTKIQAGVPVPAEAYDNEEQLGFVTRYVHGLQMQGSARVRLAPRDQLAYESLVAQYLPDHPFIRGGKLENPVLGAVVLAHAVKDDLLKAADPRMVATASKHPFLWRSLRKQLQPDSILDGRYLGYVLASYWNEPVVQGDRVFIRSSDDDTAHVFISRNGKESEFARITDPIVFFGVMRDCDVDVTGTVVLAGGARGSQSVFTVHGRTTVTCGEMRVDAESLVLQGHIWLEAERVTGSPKLELDLKNGTEIGWAGALAQSHPWRRFTSTLKVPHSVPATGSTVERLLTECTRRLSDAGALNLNNDYSIDQNDNRMRWAMREFPQELPILVKLLVQHGLATKEPAPIALMRVHFKVTWRELLNAATAPSIPMPLADFVTALRRAIK